MFWRRKLCPIAPGGGLVFRLEGEERGAGLDGGAAGVRRRDQGDVLAHEADEPTFTQPVMYRRIAAPYENAKMTVNGDAYVNTTQAN